MRNKWIKQERLVKKYKVNVEPTPQESARSSRKTVSIRLPDHTIGECKLSYSCKQFNVDLANGFCVEHWDRGGRYILRSWK